MTSSEIWFRFSYIHYFTTDTIGKVPSQVAQCHTGQSAAVRQSRHSGCQGVRVSHAYSASHASLADTRTRHDSCVQYRRDTDRLLQSLLHGAPAATFDALSVCKTFFPVW